MGPNHQLLCPRELSIPCFPTKEVGSALLPATVEPLIHHPHHCTAESFPGLTHSHCLGVSLPVLPSLGAWKTPECCMDEGQSQLYAALSHEDSSKKQPRPETSSWPLMLTCATDMDPVPCWCRAMKPDITLNYSRPLVVDQSAHVTLLLTTIPSLVLLFFIVHKVFCGSISSTSPTHICSL